MKTIFFLICALTIRSMSANEGFVPLFNGRDLSGWKIPEGDKGHWRVVDGAIDYDARSEAPASKDLWTERSFRDFTLRLEWRIKQTTGLFPMPVVLPDGTEKLGADGKPIVQLRENADSGIYLRGFHKTQVNIWCWPIGSGEVYGVRTDESLPRATRAAVTPKERADRPVGEWNQFEITLRGDRLTVVLNGRTVIENAQLPGIPEEGPLGLQHHGGYENGKYLPASSVVQFRKIAIQELR
ncbi:MAG TPA: DUF1080 domain-containing protein [Chthoniobacteraceae bacterium]|jgi:hypothetical protein